MKETPMLRDDTNTAKMEGINGDFLRLPLPEHSPLVFSPSNPNSTDHIHIHNNHNHNNNIIDDDDDDNDDFYCYSWMKIDSRSKLWTIIVLCALISVSAVVLIKRYGPIFMHKEVIPLIHWFVERFSPLVLAVILFTAISLLPILLLPTLPFKWVAGMAFGYGIGFLLITAAEAIAVSLPYTIAHHCFLHKIKKWLDNRPREAAIIRLAGDGNWFHQFQAVVLIRLAPFPYVLFNYTAVVTGVKYSPYLAGSLLGMVPEIFVAIYSGILIRTVAEAMEEHTPVSKRQLLLDGVGFCLTLVATIIIGFYSKRRLKKLQEDDHWQQL